MALFIAPDALRTSTHPSTVQSDTLKRLTPGFTIGFAPEGGPKIHDLNIPPRPTSAEETAEQVSSSTALLAQVIAEENGRLILENKHPHKVLQVGLHRLGRIALLPGMRLKLAGETFQIIEKEDDPELPGDPKEEIQETWEEQLMAHLKSLPVKESHRILELPKILPTPAVVEVSTGPQAGEVFILGWAPFEFGHLSIEGNLWEDRAPQKAFLIDFIEDHFIFRTEHPKIVQINKSELTEKRLYDGDKIFIGTTELTFRLNS
jgi:hypothetical protein